MSELLLHSDALPPDRSGTLIEVDPSRARWELVSFEVFRLLSGQHRSGETGDCEACFVVLGGVGIFETSEGTFADVGGRKDVFGGPCHALYLPLGSGWKLNAATSMEVAIGRAPARERYPARHIKPEDIELEARGDGNASRTIHHVLPPERPADRLMVVEVFTPGGNWSSYPPHKHDRHAPPAEHDLEEIYYYRIDRPGGWGIQRVYTEDRRVDETMVVRDGDLVLVREGFHPFVAAPGCNAYYLNVLAGTGRSMAATDDPSLAWVRSTWKRPQRKVI